MDLYELQTWLYDVQYLLIYSGSQQKIVATPLAVKGSSRSFSTHLPHFFTLNEFRKISKIHLAPTIRGKELKFGRLVGASMSLREKFWVPDNFWGSYRGLRFFSSSDDLLGSDIRWMAMPDDVTALNVDISAPSRSLGCSRPPPAAGTCWVT